MRRIRISIFIISITLICIGIVMVYSSSAMFSYDTYRSTTYFLRRHLAHLLVGSLLMVFVMSLDVAAIRRWIKPLFIFSLLLLLLVFFPHFGKEVGGARRWFKIGFFSFQPSEFTKWTTILFLADLMAKKKREKLGFLRDFFWPLVITASVCGLILIQPDLGGALSLGAVSMLLFFAAGMHVASIVSLILLSLPVLYFSIFNVPYRRKRILAFLNPWADAKGYGFQMVQSYLALGLGGLWGVGLGQSRQKLFYLPAAHTDFIFSIIGEELGFIGTASIVILFMLFLWQGIKISLRSTDPFIQLLSFGIVLTIVLTAFVHIAVVCGAVPTKGLPLPFISYGGSALVFNMAALGLLLNIARDRYFQEQKI
ncbi:MAG: putative lipid II flippase FtsW [Candidatus Omnitrophica bacterium]|nr:putative lipid II flippase FtsW [Candidatus Omnitrophota bacterium]